MKDFEMLRNFLSEKIHDADNRSFDTNAATLESILTIWVSLPPAENGRTCSCL